MPTKRMLFGVIATVAVLAGALIARTWSLSCIPFCQLT